MRRLPGTRACLGPRLLAVALVAWGPGAHADEVRLLEATALDWPEARRGLVAELSSAGFEVVPLPSEATEPEALLEELSMDSEQRFVASAVALREGEAGVAYVCLRGSPNVFRVASTDGEPTLAAQVVALRVAELIALHGRQDAPREPEPAAPSPSPRAKKREQRRDWEVGLGMDLRWSSGLHDPLVELNGGLGRRIVEWLWLDARGTWSVTPSGRAFDDGSVEVQVRTFGLGLSAHLDDAFARSASRRGWLSSLGARGALECFEITAFEGAATAGTESTACIPALALHARFGYRVDHWSFWLGSEGSFGLQAVRLVSQGTELATLGRPSATLDAGVSWHF